MADTRATLSNKKSFKWLSSTHTYRDDGGFVTLKHGDTIELTDEQAKSPGFDGKVAPVATVEPKVQAAPPPPPPAATAVSTDTTPPPPPPTTTTATGATREDEIRAALAGTVPQAITFVNSLAVADLATARKIEQEGSARASVLKIIDGRIAAAAATTKA